MSFNRRRWIRRGGLAWARQAATPNADAVLRQRVWTELDESRQHLERQIARLEVDVAEILVTTPYLWLLLLPGINVVSAADLAGGPTCGRCPGPIDHDANANAITGRAGLFPARWQSDEGDVTGSLVRCANRRLRAALSGSASRRGPSSLADLLPLILRINSGLSSTLPVSTLALAAFLELGTLSRSLTA